MSPGKTIAVFFSSGAFGDCARHAILHAMENQQVSKIKVYSRKKNMPSLDLSNWKCGCKVDHGAEMKKSPNVSKIEQIIVDVTNKDDVEGKVDLSDVDAVISGIGNRQIFFGDRVARKGTRNVVKAMNKASIDRIVAMSSMGVNEDKPCMEWRSEGKVMTVLFNTICRREYNDIAGMEKDLRATDLNYLLVRPVGLGEDCDPRGEYFIQKKKYEDALGPNMAKNDVGRFLLDQVLAPTYDKRAVVIGADPKEAYDSFESAGMAKNDEDKKREDKK